MRLSHAFFSCFQINTDYSLTQLNPSRHADQVANYASAMPEQFNASIDPVLAVKPAWENMPFEDRAAVFLRACELITDKYRSEIVAATTLGQSKTIYQAEIDAAVENIDFFRQYVKECENLFALQPKIKEPGT